MVGWFIWSGTHIWVPSQCIQDLFGGKTRARSTCRSTVCRHWCAYHHHSWQATPQCCSGFQNFHRWICEQQDAGLDKGNHAINWSRSIWTSCCISCLHSWIIKPMDLFTEDIPDLLLPLENAIHQQLIPALTGCPLWRETCLPSLLDLVDWVWVIQQLHLQISSKLLKASQHPIKKNIRKSNHLKKAQQASNINGQLSPQLKRSVDLATEKGSSSWLSVLPLEEHGFYLHKGEFRDAICLRYGWRPGSIPQTCNCGAQ